MRAHIYWNTHNVIKEASRAVGEREEVRIATSTVLVDEAEDAALQVLHGAVVVDHRAQIAIIVVDFHLSYLQLESNEHLSRC